MITMRQRKALELRSKGYTVAEIAKLMDCSRQNVSILLKNGCSEHAERIENNPKKSWDRVIYPNIKKWMQENRVSQTSFSKMCGYTSVMSIRRCIVDGLSPSKGVIDAILRVTGMTYEEAFKKGEEANDNE